MTTLAAELPLTTRTAYKARVLIRERLGDMLPAIRLSDLLTVVSELITNAVDHGHGDTVRMRLSVAANGKVSGEVENDGYARVELRPIDTRSTSGLGLHIVGAIADRWPVFVGDSTRVRFELLES
jgi:anti-sigma regulatory factor (Ser/Thr protein kinase)